MLQGDDEIIIVIKETEALHDVFTVSHLSLVIEFLSNFLSDVFLFSVDNSFESKSFTPLFH